MHLFITGGTGFLGNVLIKDLINEGHHLYLLARNKTKANKLIKTMDIEKQKQIHFIYGDITLPNLGINEEIITNLRNQIDTVIHMAALVKFDEALETELKQINYMGTKHTLEFADAIHAKAFYYVSTAYTVGTQNIGKEKLYPLDQSFNNPYEETKCMAEHLVFDYQDKMKTVLFRPAIIVGHSQTGEANSTFTIYGFIKGLEIFKRRMSKKKDFTKNQFHLYSTPDSTSNLVPVDYVSQVLVTALKHGKRNQIYHITNPNAPKNEIILSHIKHMLNFTNLALTNSLKKIKTKEEALLNSLVSNFTNYLSRNISFSDKNTKQMLQNAGKKHLEMDDFMLKRIIDGYLTL